MSRHLYVIQSPQTVEAINDLQRRAQCNLLVLPDALVNACSAHQLPILRANDYRRALGKEYHSLYLHLDTPINLNLLAALIPTVKTGGTLLIGMAAHVIESHANHGFTASACGAAIDINAFVLTSILQHAQMVCTGIDQLPISERTLTCELASIEVRAEMLSQSQQTALKRLRTLLPNHCCLLTGPRGSGKSTLAKILLSDWKNPLRVVTNWGDSSPWANETLVTLEQLLANTTGYLNAFDAILVDEAATIPIHHLNRLAERAQVLLISTMDSYEGSGNGLSLKISSLIPVIELGECFRFNPNDRLSQCYQLLFPAQHNRLPLTELTTHYAGVSDKLVVIEKIAPYEQFKADYQLCYRLLAQFHYQTQPRDLFTFFNTPDCELLLYIKDEQPVAMVVAFTENAIYDQSLREEITVGKRRPKGRLMQQRLAHYFVEPQLLALNLCRISRIVVAASHRRQGIGSRIIIELRERYAQLNHCLVVSYASDPGIDKFWLHNGFITLLTGKRIDGASGQVSRFMADTIGFAHHIAPILLPKEADPTAKHLRQGSHQINFRLRRLKCFALGQRALREVIEDIREQVTVWHDELQHRSQQPCADTFRELNDLLAMYERPNKINQHFTERKSYDDAIRKLLCQLMANH